MNYMSKAPEPIRKMGQVCSHPSVAPPYNADFHPFIT